MLALLLYRDSVLRPCHVYEEPSAEVELPQPLIVEVLYLPLTFGGWAGTSVPRPMVRHEVRRLEHALQSPKPC